MTPEQAITVLTNATAMLQCTRPQHQEIIAALKVLGDLLVKKVP